MDLPTELVCLIVDNVAHNEDCTSRELATTLRSCCLVSHDWCAFAQPYLYSRFSRYKQDYWNMPFIQTLLGSKHLQSYTRALWIDENYWIENGPEKDLLFRLLPQLHELGIWESGYLRLLESQSLERVVVATQNLTALNLQSISRFPVAMFDNWGSLEELRINNTTLSGFSYRSGMPSHISTASRRPTIRYLHMEFNREDEIRTLAWMQHPECSLNLSSIKTLHLDHQMEPELNFRPQLLNEFKSFCSSKVEDVLIQPDVAGLQVDSMAPTDQAKELTQIRIIRFQWTLDEISLRRLAVLPWIFTFLSALPHPERLEEVWIPGFIPNEEQEEFAKIQDGYKDLESLLTSTKFKNVRKLWILYDIDPDKSELREKIEQSCAQLWSKIYQSGRIRIQLHFSDYGGLALRESEVWFYGAKG